jgi:hypothetical protein
MSVSGGNGERVDVQVQGDIPYQARQWAVILVDRAVRRGPWRLVQARVRLTRPPHLVATCRADIQGDLGGLLFQTRADPREARAALEIAAERLHRQAESLRAAQQPDAPHR